MERSLLIRNLLPPQVVLLAVLLAALLVGVSSRAADERYDYDESGRLIRAIGDDGQATRYVYDPVGNLLQVVTGEQSSAPVIDTLTPASVRQGEPVHLIAEGSGLVYVGAATDHPGLQVSHLHGDSGRLEFDLLADTGVPLGPHVLTFSNAAGVAEAAIAVQPATPKVYVTPSPMAAPPDGLKRGFLLRLSHADLLDHAFTLTVEDPGVATVEPAGLAIAAGGTEVSGLFAGLAVGHTVLRIDSPTLGTSTVHLYVTEEFAGVNTSRAPPLGVTVTVPETPAPNPYGDLATPEFRLLKGRAIADIRPDRVTIGDDALLEVTGFGLDQVDGAVVEPAEGVSVGAPTGAPDGHSLSLPLSVAGEAPVGMRRLLLTAAGEPVPAVTPEGDRFLVTLPPPVIDSVAPLQWRVGSEKQLLTIRGRGFHDLLAVELLPADGVEIGSASQVFDDGTRIEVELSVSPVATLGSRVVNVVTDGGGSGEAATAHNTIHIVWDEPESVPGLPSPLLGVVVGDPDTPEPAYESRLQAPLVGVSRGGVVSGVSPAKGIVGESLILVVSGERLDGVTGAAFEPADGITIDGGIEVTADGNEVRIPIAIAPDAPQALRTVKLLAGDAVLPASPADAGGFLVTAPPPVFHSLSPLILPPGATTRLTLRGEDLQGAIAFNLLPATGIEVNPGGIQVDDGGTLLTADVVVAAQAPEGPRVVEVVTAGGSSGTVATDVNTVYVAAGEQHHYTPISSRPLGVVVERTDVEDPPVATQLHSPLLGVQVGEPAEESPEYLQVSPEVGVARGPVALSVAPAEVLPGHEGTLAIGGRFLDGATGIAVEPADGIALGPLGVSGDGRSLEATLTVDAGAAPGVRRIVIAGNGGEIPFADPAAARIELGVGAPSILSIEPILAGQGSQLELLIRGGNLDRAYAVTATPADGIAFGATLSLNGDATELRIPMVIAADAPLGPRVIRVHVPGAVTSAIAEPANTFTIYESVPE